MKEKTSLKSLQNLQIVLCAIIDRAVPLVICWSIEDSEALSSFFEQFMESFIVPIIPAFLAVSERDLAYLHHSDSVGSSKPGSATPPSAYVDRRASLIALVQSALLQIQSSLPLSVELRSCDAVDAGSARARGDFSVLLLSLILAILRHIRSILEDDVGISIKSRLWRIRRLAIKDALWYLSCTMHFLFELYERVPCMISMDGVESLESPWRTRVTLLKHAIQDITVELVLYQDRKRAAAFTKKIPDHIADEDSTLDTGSKASKYIILDDLEYRMLLHLAERATS